MHKPKKLHTESDRDNKRELKISESPRKITKLKLGTLLEAGKQKEIENINEVVRQKLEEHPESASRSVPQNPYQASYQTDMAIWQQYCDYTQRYQHSGISLKWPYFFTSSSKHKE